eukprot:TRINITY_DN1153_c0_g1_i1.p1 TRINITY_DN1153_c0_g1~~TRINITY_DN1153_c0_g1_i1.p1  ORF type:complete len:131 (+),score=24.69 TRINITY_DN1153_c0_g1_i1:695-1087(+)
MPVAQLFLVVPPAAPPNAESPSVIANGFGYGLTWEQLNFYHSLSVNSSDGSRGQMSFYALDHDLTGLPETTILAQKFDPLLTDAQLIHQELQRVGTKSTYYEEDNMHASMIVNSDYYKQILFEVLAKADQ